MTEESIYTRTEMMLGRAGVERLRNARVAVFGVGGVGGFAVEALARAGVGSLTLIDSDKVNVTNRNRQIIATVSTEGKYKCDAAKERIADINPDCTVTACNLFYSKENADEFDLTRFDYVIDAIDSVQSKVLLIKEAHLAGTPIISSMGAGNKLDPTRFTVSDISKTHTDPLAKAVRTALRREGIDRLKVVFSDEPPLLTGEGRTPGSISFVPSVVGLILAAEVIKDIALDRLKSKK